MCTLIVYWKCRSDAPLVLALNRDEFVERPTRGLHVWEDFGPNERIIAGRDLRSGGTWFALGHRVTAALTNHRSGVRSMPGERSRGDLVVTTARCGSAASAAEAILALNGQPFGPFHLLIADANDMIWITNRNGAFESHAVAPGLHILGNYGMDNEDDAVVKTLHRELAGSEALEWTELAELMRRTLATSGPGWPCVDLGVYGTRSSAIIRRGGSEATLLESDASPSLGNWKDASNLLSEL